VTAIAKPVDWRKYPLRKCQCLRDCRICGKRIAYGERYYDGRHAGSAHVGCA
jgi:hypothetical protein